MNEEELKKELADKECVLGQLEAIDCPPREYIHTWLYNLRANNHSCSTIVDKLKYTDINKELFTEKLLIKWDDFVCEGYGIPWQVYEFCESYLQSTELDDNCKEYGYDDEEKKEYIKEIEDKQKEAEQAMELIQARIAYVKDKIDFIENEIFKIDHF
tara:strand:- start:37 stop:507 length:471 start_codon:yes stop_codon:yes gene_type:complete